MATFKFDDLVKQADEKHYATVIEFGEDKLELRNVIRLSKTEREALKEFQDATDVTDDEDVEAMFDRLAGLVRILAHDKKLAEKFLDLMEGRIEVLAEIVGAYMDDQSAGKASQSQN